MENQQCYDLIGHYGRHRVLWDTTLAGYHNKQLREDAWKKISREMNQPVAPLKKKMKSLMGSYRREKSRMRHSLITGSGVGEVYQSKWFAFHSFAFLADRDIPHPTQDTINDISEATSEPEANAPTEIIEEEEEPEASTSFDGSCGHGNSGRASRTAGASRPAKRRAVVNDNANGAMLQEAFNILKTSANGPIEDPCYSFGLHVGNELRKYDPQTLARVKHVISTALFDADMGRYSGQNNYTHYHDPSLASTTSFHTPYFPSDNIPSHNL